jgi:hypothetical protein
MPPPSVRPPQSVKKSSGGPYKGPSGKTYAYMPSSAQNKSSNGSSSRLASTTLKHVTNNSKPLNGSNSPQSAPKSSNRSATRKSAAPNRSDHAKHDVIINKIDELSTKTNEIIERLEEIKTHRDDKEQRKIRQKQRTNRQLIPFHGF